MHMAIFSIPAKIAVRFAIPLVVWGENSAFEYGGREQRADRFQSRRGMAGASRRDARDDGGGLDRNEHDAE